LGEIRKDYFVDRWVVIEPERAKRPSDLVKIIKKEEEGTCFLSKNKTVMMKE
jgi:galactose-1-phosphate uridylyltransferase